MCKCNRLIASKCDDLWPLTSLDPLLLPLLVKICPPEELADVFTVLPPYLSAAYLLELLRSGKGYGRYPKPLVLNEVCGYCDTPNKALGVCDPKPLGMWSKTLVLNKVCGVLDPKPLGMWILLQCIPKQNTRLGICIPKPLGTYVGYPKPNEVGVLDATGSLVDI